MVAEISAPEPRSTADAPQARDTRIALAAVAAFVLALLVKLPQLSFTHREPDEIIYWQLAQRLWQSGEYTLRGTRVLPLLPASMYDHPVFHHPPLLPLLLGPWAASDKGPYPPGTTLWIPWLAHAAFAAATVVLGFRLARARPDRVALVLAVLATALDPFGWFEARFLWIDAVSLACAALAGAFGIGASSRTRLALAGLCAGLAGVAKLTGLVVLPFLIFDLVRRKPPRASWIALLAPPIALVGTWLALFYSRTGHLLPTWIAPDEAILARDELMREGFSRSPFAYAWLAPLGAPLLAWIAAAWFKGSAATRDAARPLAAWSLLGCAAIASTTWLGTTPVQLRQLAPALPAAYALAIALLVEHRGSAWRILFALGVAVGAANAVASVHGKHVYELGPFWS